MSETQAALQRSDKQPIAGGLLGALVLAVGMSAFAVFGLHKLVSVDLGYHLAYGRWMVENGRVLSHNEFSYTCPGWEFVNANWLFQVGLHAVHALGGAAALSALLLGLIGVLGLLLAVYLYLRGTHPLVAALVLAAVALTSYERFLLRPELITFICLVATLILLDRRAKHPRATWLGLAGVQVLWVNCHSYFLLGPALVGMHLLVQLVLMMVRLAARRPTADLRRDVLWLAIATMLTLACCLINPRGVTGAVFPLKTLAYLQQTDAMTAQPGQAQGGPWGVITEFSSPLTEAKIPLVMQTAYRASLVLGVLAGIGQILRRRLLDLPTLLVLLPASLAMRRNIPLWALAAWPAVAELVSWALAVGASRLRGRRWVGGIQAAATVCVVVVLAMLCYDILANRFYVRERRELRVGVGLSRLAYPVGAVEFLRDRGANERLYCQFEVGSYLLCFGEPSQRVFVHSDTFAYPPAFFGQAVESQAKPRLFEDLESLYGFDTVILKHTLGRAHKLIKNLAASDKWRLVYLDHNSVVLTERKGEHADRFADFHVDPNSLDLPNQSAQLARLDPAAQGWPMVFVGNVLLTLGWEDQALASYRLAVEQQPGLYEAWNQLGVLWGQRAGQAADAGDGFAQRQYHLKALDCFGKAADLKPGYKHAKRNLEIARKNLGL